MARNIELARLFYTLEANTKGLSRDLSGAEKALGRTAAFITANPIVAFGALGAAALGAAAKATQMAAQFETGISRVSTLVDTTRVDMKGLSDGVLELFRSLPIKSVDDLSNGLFDIISAGVPAEKALDVLRISAEASVGGFTDVSTVVKGVTVALNVFGKDGIDAAKAADLFFVANKLGVTTIEELSSTIGNAAGIAGTLGVSLQDLLGTVTTLTTKGLATSVAMNSVRQVLVNIAKPTAELNNEFPGLAKEFDLAALKSKGLAGFLTDLAKELKGNDTAAVKMFGSVEALGAVMALTQDGGAKLNDVMRQMNNATGAAAEALGKAGATAENVSQVLKNQLTVAMIDLGNAILPTVNAGLRDFIVILDLIQGRTATIELNRVVATMQTLSQSLNKISGAGHDVAFKRLAAAIKELVDVDLTGRLTGQGRASIGGLSTEALQATINGVGALIVATSNAGQSTTGLTATLGELGRELATRTPAAAKSTATAITGIAGAAVSAVTGMTKDAAARLKALNEEIAVLTIQSERGVTAVRARELLQRERDLGASNERQVRSLGEAYAEVDRLNSQLSRGLDKTAVALENTLSDLGVTVKDRLGRGFIEAQEPAVTLGTTLTNLSARALPDLKDGFDRVAEATGLSREQVEKHSQAGGRWIQVGDKWIGTAGEAGKKTEDLAKELEKGARSAIDAAGAIGAIDRSAQGTLNTLVNLGTSIAAVFTGVGTTQGVFSIIAGVGSLLKGIFGGKSPAQKAAEATLKKNTQVLEENSRRLGDLVRLSTPGAQLASVQDVLGKFLNQFAGKPDSATSKQSTSIALGRLLAAQGVGQADLDRIASDLGLTIKDNNGNFILGALRQLLSVLGTIEPTQFAKTFQGQREALSREATLFDLTGAEQAQRLAALAGGQLGSSAIGARLGGLDFGTAEGREAGLAAVRQLFRDLPGLSARDLGGLSGSDFLAVLEDLKSFLEEAAGAAEEPLATPSDPLPVTVADPTTPSVADALIPAAISQEALMADLLVVNQDQLGTLRLIEQHLREAFSPVAAPLFASLAAPTRASAAAGIPAFGGGPTISVTIQSLSIDARIPGSDNISIDSIIAQLSAGLAQEILEAEQAAGVSRARLN